MHLTRLTEKSAQFEAIKQFMTKNLGNGIFISSMILILLVSLGFFTFFYFYVNPKESIKTVAISGYQPVTANPNSLNLNLSSPDDNLLVFDPNLLVSGQTGDNTLILISVNDNNRTLNASSKGDFSLTLKLQPGINMLTVSAFDNQGNYKSEVRSIYYSEEKL